MQNNIFQIYLAGGMQNLSFEEQNEWRERLNNWLIARCKTSSGDMKPINIINPVDYYNFQEKLFDTDKEVMRFDTNFVRNNDLIIVNANDPKSIGTSMEIAIAYEHRIPILILNENKEMLHSWWIEMSDRVFTNLKELCEYVCDFYIKMNHYDWTRNIATIGVVK